MADERDLKIGNCHMSTVLARLHDRMELISCTDEELTKYCTEGKGWDSSKGDTDDEFYEEPITKEDLLRAATMPMLIVGKPGVGKTMGILGAVNNWNRTHSDDKRFGFKKIVLSMTEVGSMQGIPIVVNGEAKRIPVSDFPVEERDGRCGILFLDEITTADTQQVQPILPIIDGSRSIGEYTLPPHWLVVAAGNRPDDANFMEMKDMTLSRFEAYNVETDYEKDWRPWARANGVDPMILAFLNWKPENFIRVITDIDEEPEVGKQFSTARTWESLSCNLKARKAIGRPVSKDEMYVFSAAFIGQTVASEFAAFCEFRRKLHVSPKKILKGEEKSPVEIYSKGDGVFNLEAQEWHILSQGVISALKVVIEGTYDYESRDFSDVAVESSANALRWVLELQDYCLEYVINFIVQLRNEVTLAGDLLRNPEFVTIYCPEYSEFTVEHSEMFSRDDISLDY